MDNLSSQNDLDLSEIQFTNFPERSDTEADSNRESNNQPHPHCPLKAVTENANLKSLISHGGDEVNGDAKYE
ncbi:MAG: hypothetical protein ACK41T_11295 [Pseudobdellovibrio sp.]